MLRCCVQLVGRKEGGEGRGGREGGSGGGGQQQASKTKQGRDRKQFKTLY